MAFGSFKIPVIGSCFLYLEYTIPIPDHLIIHQIPRVQILPRPLSPQPWANKHVPSHP